MEFLDLYFQAKDLMVNKQVIVSFQTRVILVIALYEDIAEGQSKN